MCAHAMLEHATNVCCDGAVTSGSDGIVKEFHEALQRSPDTAVAVAAIKVQRSTPIGHVIYWQKLRILCKAQIHTDIYQCCSLCVVPTVKQQRILCSLHQCYSGTFLISQALVIKTSQQA